jgi:hypothetical protein
MEKYNRINIFLLDGTEHLGKFMAATDNSFIAYSDFEDGRTVVVIPMHQVKRFEYYREDAE